MNVWDYVLIAALIVIAALAVRSAHRQKKRGGCAGCTGDCSSCGKKP